MPELFDTHCHINLPEEFPEPGAAINEAQKAGVTRLAIVGIDADSCKRAIQIADRFQDVYAIVGWHPNSAATFTSEALAQIRQMLGHPKAIALGETGLDYHWDYATREQQMNALLAQLDLAQELGKPVVFHCRKAQDDLLDVLEKRPMRRYLFHCFSGDQKQAQRALTLGGTLGFDGPVTFKNAVQLRRIISEIPHDRIVLETDSPYLTPEPHRGKPNKPAYLPLICDAVAGCLGITPDECAELTTSNARRFFGI
jgi:TatD DNase family protein